MELVELPPQVQLTLLISPETPLPQAGLPQLPFPSLLILHMTRVDEVRGPIGSCA